MKDYDMDTHNIITDILKHHLGGSGEHSSNDPVDTNELTPIVPLSSQPSPVDTKPKEEKKEDKKVEETKAKTENNTYVDTKPKEEKKEDEKVEETNAKTKEEARNNKELLKEKKAKTEAEAINIKELLEILKDIYTNYEICASEEDEFKTKLGKIINILNKQNNDDNRIVLWGKSLLRNLQALDLKDEFKDLLKPLIEYITADNTSLRKQNTDIKKQLNNAKE